MNTQHTQRQDLVPGVMRCAKCEFQLQRVNLYVQSGTAGAGDSNTEPCPNGCGPLWPVTWKQWAGQLQDSAERLAAECNDLKAANAELVAVLQWLHIQGGLGIDKHKVIAEAIAKAGEVK